MRPDPRQSPLSNEFENADDAILGLHWSETRLNRPPIHGMRKRANTAMYRLGGQPDSRLYRLRGDFNWTKWPRVISGSIPRLVLTFSG
jgi:hypothetical protein